jgi:uncharacterized protein YxjI
MEIDINQKKISIGDKYSIFTDGQQTHSASRELFHLLPVVTLSRNNNDGPVMTIKRRLSWFRAKYDIILSGTNILEFRTVSYLKSQYQCRNGNDCYDIYGHRGRKYSIYKNNKQVAYWDKQAVSWFAGDNYKIIADKGSDVDLLIGFCLIIDNFRSDDHDGKTVDIDVGNIFFQAKKFDTGWQPKY